MRTSAKFPSDLRRTIASEEAEALHRFRIALPDNAIIPIIADPLIRFGGSLHCIAMTYEKPFPGFEFSWSAGFQLASSPLDPDR